MAGKWNLLRRSKNPEPHDCRLVCRRQHEYGLGKVHFTGNLLQLEVGVTLRVGEHRYLVAPKVQPGEHISLIELERPAVRHVYPRTGTFTSFSDQLGD